MTVFPYMFADPFGDARLAELRVLSWAEQHEKLEVGGHPTVQWRDVLLSLVSDGLLTTFSYNEARHSLSQAGHGSSPSMASGTGIVGESRLERSLVLARVAALDTLYQGGGGVFRLTHSGRVRLSELKQALRAGREREAFGILWDTRHWEQDLQIALIDVTTAAPLSIVYMDMNGLKALNDAFGHDAGDDGLRVYFHAVASVLGDGGQAYRLGGDEVLMLLPGKDTGAAVRATEVASRRLMSERIRAAIHLSISAGVVCVTDSDQTPMDIRAAADASQYRAKAESRKETPRPSVIAVEGTGELTIIPPDSARSPS